MVSAYPCHVCGEPGRLIRYGPKQLPIYFVNFSAPMFDSHCVHPSESYFRSRAITGTTKKPAATYSPLGVAAGSMKAFCTGFLGLQHFTPNLRLPASPIGKEAVGKSEVEKCTSATHDLG